LISAPTTPISALLSEGYAGLNLLGPKQRLLIAHNHVANFHDGIDHATSGAPDGNPDGNPYVIRERVPIAIDIYSNDITNVDDNCICKKAGQLVLEEFDWTFEIKSID
jgi:hypothetical protein